MVTTIGISARKLVKDPTNFKNLPKDAVPAGKDVPIVIDSVASIPQQDFRDNKTSERIRRLLIQFVKVAGWVALVACSFIISYAAYDVRLFAIRAYGPVIHEHDPWFNFRATKYLADQGWYGFFRWFDHKVWHPLGRPVGTTIYPGMQMASVMIWRLLSTLGRPWSLNDVCCYVPAWFGSAASIFTGLLAHEGMHDANSSGATFLASAAIMAIIPAHAKRSIGGGFDNESVAIAPMVATWWLWSRALRTSMSWPIAAFAGCSFAATATSWGGYVFAANVVGAHAGLLLLAGYDQTKLYRAYSLYYVVGIALATRIPIVGCTPLVSLEQLCPLVVFVSLQIAPALRWVWKRCGFGVFRGLPVTYASCAVVVAVFAVLFQSGQFFGLSARVRALFGKTANRTGNPLVDSVSEHNPSSPDAYWTYLHYAGYLATAGPAALCCKRRRPSEATVLVLLLGASTFYFSSKMNRLMILVGPSCSVLAGSVIGRCVDVALIPFWSLLDPPDVEARSSIPSRRVGYTCSRLVWLLTVGLMVYHKVPPFVQEFYKEAVHTIQWKLSHPQIMTKNGKGEIIDEIRETYWWIQNNTSADARILAWWDYGYQITGISDRITLADGNTWNMDHIGLIGMALTAPLAEGHRITRHVADYVLIFEEDLRKSHHMARIANAAYQGHCGDDRCDQYGVYANGQPTQMMSESMVWKMLKEGGAARDKFYREVYSSRGRRVRVFKILDVSLASRNWSLHPANYLCDAAGSWYCPGQYPIGLRKLMGWTSFGPDDSEATEHQAQYQSRIDLQAAAEPGPNGPDIPPGSYLESCQGCNVESDKHFITCQRCSSPGHASSPSRLDLRRCAEEAPWTNGAVDNIQGQLRCKAAPNRDDIPVGAYSQSCQGCRLSADQAVLICTFCPSVSGKRNPASMNVASCPPPYQIGNSNGRLVCYGLPSGDDLPLGSYSSSCQGCFLHDGDSLRCSHCFNSMGSQVHATLAMNTCSPPSHVVNNDGQLQCSPLPQ